MMNYSLGGYLSALILRNTKTLLLEGATDKIVVSRVLHDIEKFPHFENRVCPDIVLDTSDLIRLTREEYELTVNNSNDDIGGRELVELVYKSNLESGVENFAIFVDREYRGFTIADKVSDDIKDHYVISPYQFWTRGHSIENYFFEQLYFLAILKQQFSEVVTSTLLGVVEADLPIIMRETLAIGLTVNEMKLLTRCKGIARMHHWNIREQAKIALDTSELASDLRKRGVDREALVLFEEKINQFREILSQSDEVAIFKWANHGHLGLDFIWCAIARIVELQGGDSETTRQIARGHIDYKLRAAADMWVREVLEGRTESPDALWQWLTSPR